VAGRFLLRLVKAKQRRKLYTLPETVRMLLSAKLAKEDVMIDGKGRYGSDAVIMMSIYTYTTHRVCFFLIAV
jgi:hypothetical protein